MSHHIHRCLNVSFISVWLPVWRTKCKTVIHLLTHAFLRLLVPQVQTQRMLNCEKVGFKRQFNMYVERFLI